MNIPTFLTLLGAFGGPILYQRIHFALFAKDFLKTPLRSKTGLQIHHAHWGILWILVASIWLLFGDKNIYVVGLMGFGWGLLVDEIFPSLHMPTISRELELRVYGASLKHTFFLAGAIILVFIALFIFFGNHRV